MYTIWRSFAYLTAVVGLFSLLPSVLTHYSNVSITNLHHKLCFAVLIYTSMSHKLDPYSLIDLFHKSQNAPVPYPTMLHSEQKCAHFCSEWSIVGYGRGAFWDLRNWSITTMFHGISVLTLHHVLKRSSLCVLCLTLRPMSNHIKFI